MNKQSYTCALLLTITFSCAAMDQGSKDGCLVRVPRYNIRRSRIRKQAEVYLTKAIACEVMGHQESGMDGTKIARILEHYLIAQKAREDGDDKSCERHLLEAAEHNYSPSYLELAVLYLKKAKECYQRAKELGDTQAAAILVGLKKYSLERLLTGHPQFKQYILQRSDSELLNALLPG